MSHKLPIHRFILSLIVCASLLALSTAYAQDDASSEKIIFALSQQSPTLIRIMNSDGSDLHPLNDREKFENNPQLSPDRASIAYVGEDGSNYEVFVMDVDGSNPRQITKLGRRFAPTFA